MCFQLSGNSLRKKHIWEWCDGQGSKTTCSIFSRTFIFCFPIFFFALIKFDKSSYILTLCKSIIYLVYTVKGNTHDRCCFFKLNIWKWLKSDYFTDFATKACEMSTARHLCRICVSVFRVHDAFRMGSFPPCKFFKCSTTKPRSFKTIRDQRDPWATLRFWVFWDSSTSGECFNEKVVFNVENQIVLSRFVSRSTTLATLFIMLVSRLVNPRIFG